MKILMVNFVEAGKISGFTAQVPTRLSIYASAVIGWPFIWIHNDINSDICTRRDTSLCVQMLFTKRCRRTLQESRTAHHRHRCRIIGDTSCECGAESRDAVTSISRRSRFSCTRLPLTHTHTPDPNSTTAHTHLQQQLGGEGGSLPVVQRLHR